MTPPKSSPPLPAAAMTILSAPRTPSSRVVTPLTPDKASQQSCLTNPSPTASRPSPSRSLLFHRVNAALHRARGSSQSPSPVAKRRKPPDAGHASSSGGSKAPARRQLHLPGTSILQSVGNQYGGSINSTGLVSSSSNSSSSSSNSSSSNIIGAPIVYSTSPTHHVQPPAHSGPPSACNPNLTGKCMHSNLTIAKCGFCKPCHSNAMLRFGHTMRCTAHADHRCDHVPRGKKRQRDSLQNPPSHNNSPPQAATKKYKPQLTLHNTQPQHTPGFTFTTPAQATSVPKTPTIKLPPPEPPPTS